MKPMSRFDEDGQRDVGQWTQDNGWSRQLKCDSGTDRGAFTYSWKIKYDTLCLIKLEMTIV